MDRHSVPHCFLPLLPFLLLNDERLISSANRNYLTPGAPYQWETPIIEILLGAVERRSGTQLVWPWKCWKRQKQAEILEYLRGGPIRGGYDGYYGNAAANAAAVGAGAAARDAGMYVPETVWKQAGEWGMYSLQGGASGSGGADVGGEILQEGREEMTEWREEDEAGVEVWDEDEVLGHDM